jgi:uncharacterized protein (TIGR03118 family)
MRHSTRDSQHSVPEGKHKRPLRKRRPAVEGLEERALLSAAHDLAVPKHVAIRDTKPVPVSDHKTTPVHPAGHKTNPVLLAGRSYNVTLLVSNINGKAQLYDPSLVDPWDTNSPQDQHDDPYVWVSDQGSGQATFYNIDLYYPSDGKTVEKENTTTDIPDGPTGVVPNNTNGFLIPAPGYRVSASYIFDTLDGSIGGYNQADPFLAEIIVRNNPETTMYTGLAAGTVGKTRYIYAVNDLASPGIDVYNNQFVRSNDKLPGNFVDTALQGTGFVPYGVRDLGNMLFVTYRGPDWKGGAIAEFYNDGTFDRQIAYNRASGPLQSPWGLAQFGPGTDLLVGNYSSGQIDRYNFTSGQLEGTLNDSNGNPITIPGLRSLHFYPGTGSSGTTKVALLFTADPDNGKNGLYGEITSIS